MNSSVRFVQWLTLKPSVFSTVRCGSLAAVLVQAVRTANAINVADILLTAKPLHAPVQFDLRFLSESLKVDEAKQRLAGNPVRIQELKNADLTLLVGDLDDMVQIDSSLIHFRAVLIDGAPFSHEARPPLR
jgi:hypothetical protein